MRRRPLRRVAVATTAPVVALVSDAGPQTMPDLRGLSARDAMRTLMKLGLSARMSGHGVVLSQDPPPGTALRRRRNLPAAAGPPPFGVAGRRRRAMTWAELHGVLREARAGPR